MSNGKRKGNKAERELCKWWKEWTGLEFTRIPASGGLRWKTFANATSGDLICADERHGRRFQFSIESKSYKDINFEHLILGNKKVKILEFWSQAKEDAQRASKVPILFMRYNGMNKNTYFIVMEYRVYDLIHASIIFNYPRFEVKGPEPMVIMNSNDLLKVDYLQLHKSLKSFKNGQKEK